MAYFAVVAVNNEPPRVTRCHINIWRLPGLTGPAFYFDIGLGLQGSQQYAPREFRLALPFSADGGPTSLKNKVLSNNIGHLIFGRAVTIQNEVLSYKDRAGEEVRLKIIGYDSATIEASKSGNDYSVWNIRLPEKLTIDAECYVRLRFKVRTFSRTWINYDRGELVDLRLADTRESRAIPSWQSHDQYIVHMDNVRVFIVVAARLRPRLVSPTTTVRLLESSVWQDYLGRRPGVLMRERLAIYRFGESILNVDGTKPFRVYLDLSTRAALGGMRFWAFLLILMLVSNFTVQLLVEVRSQVVDFVVSQIWKPIIGLGVVGILGILLRYGRYLAKLKLVRPVLAWMDRLIYDLD